eukprot:4148473-Lingulodinium_polyedra.AAC.1
MVFVTGQFVLVARGAEWDEVWLGCPVAGTEAEWVAYTTGGDGASRQWTSVELTRGMCTPMLGAGGARLVPVGIDHGA